MNGRRVLTLVGNTPLSLDAVARVIRRTFKSRIDPSGATWRKISRETKAYYFEEFRKAYHWEDGMEARVKKAWNTLASKRYSNMLSNAKRDNKKPDFVPENAWTEWWTYWNSPEGKCIAERNKENRKGQNGVGACHTGGSISTIEIMSRLKGDGISFVDAKAKTVYDRMVDIRQQREENFEEIDENQIYLEAAVGNRSDRVYGLGAVGAEHCSNEKYGSTGSASTSYITKLENEVKNLKKVVSNVPQQLEAAKQEMEKRMEERIQELMQGMVSNRS